MSSPICDLPEALICKKALICRQHNQIWVVVFLYVLQTHTDFVPAQIKCPEASDMAVPSFIAQTKGQILLRKTTQLIKALICVYHHSDLLPLCHCLFGVVPRFIFASSGGDIAL